MAITIGTLVYVRGGKYQGLQYLGKTAMDRTVLQTMLKLCRQQGNCTAYEVLQSINRQVTQLRESGKYPGVETLQDWTLEEVKRHMSSVASRSAKNASKFIPYGIKRIPNTVYYIFDPHNERMD
jgi:hypothetical protein